MDDIYPRYEANILVNPFFIGERVVIRAPDGEWKKRRFDGRYGAVARHQWNVGTGEWWVKIDGVPRERLFHTDELRRLNLIERLGELAGGDR